jgi:glycosyltransferase involved in cell wall biosynthesis
MNTNPKTKKISAIIIAKDEEKKIRDCLESVKWSDEIILIDTGSGDKTKEIAEEYKAVIYEHRGGSYGDWRNVGLRKAQGEWVLYVDADERVTSDLKQEINATIEADNPGIFAYAIPRKNIILGREMKHGGWWPDYVKRLFRKDKLIEWSGDLHEEPRFEGELGLLESPLIHIKHDNLSEMVDKTNAWSEIEAKLLYQSGHPKMTWWRFFRIMLTELWLRLIVKMGFLDGVEGVIYSIYQMWSRFITYGKLWEMQLEHQRLKLNS